MKQYLACLALSQLVLPGTVLAANSAQSAEAANERVCKIVEGTGWRLGRQRVCKTRAEWEKLSREAQQEMRADRRGSGEASGQ